jgi:hypothetical protein
MSAPRERMGLSDEAIAELVATYRADCNEAQAEAPKKRGPREKLERRRLVFNCYLALEAEGIQPASHAKGNVAALAEAVHELAMGTPRRAGWADYAMEVSAELRAGQRLTEFVAERGSVSEVDLGVFIDQEADREAERRKNFKKLNSPK